MKKILLLLLPLWCSAQTTIIKTVLPSLDTLRVTTTVTTSVKYDTLKYKVTKPGGLTSNPVTYSYKSNFTISSLSFAGGSSDFITLNNCSNVHITMCRFSGANVWAIVLINCKNITIDYNFFISVCKGVAAINCTGGIKINNNQLLNLYEPILYKNDFAHAFQLNSCTGGGNQINYNTIENIYGAAIHPHDIINLYNTRGLQGDSVQVIGNKIRGGQVDGGWPNSGSTGAGITLDNGSYITVRNNIGINPGCAFIQVNGTHSNILVDNNLGVSLISSKVAADAFIALGAKTNVTFSNNRANWRKWNGAYGVYPGGETGLWTGSSTINPAIRFVNNKWFDTTLSTPLLPSTIITWQ